MTLRLSELDPLYRSVPRAEAIAIANLGAQCYSAVKDRLYANWEAANTEEDAERAAVWRKEGGSAMLESLRTQLAAGETAQARIAQLQSGWETEVSARVEALVAIREKEMELTKREEILEVRAQMSELQASAKGSMLVEEYNATLKEKLSQVTAELETFKATKSSHALGKIGEATVFEILENYVAPKFSYAEVVNVSKTKHVGDIHMTMMMQNGKPIRIMIDVKNYNTAVSNKEIDKLYSDLDEHESDVGLMISLESPICKRSAFQITKTPKGKPCMFLSLEAIDDEQRKEVLCWAVRSLQGVVSMKDHSSQDAMIAGIKQFLVEMSVSLEMLDANVRSAKAHYESLRDTKIQMIDRVQSYRVSCGMDPVTPVAPAGAVKKRVTSGSCQGHTAKGEQCKSKRFLVGGFCQLHRPAAGTVTHIETVTEEGGDAISHVE